MVVLPKKFSTLLCLTALSSTLLLRPAHASLIAADNFEDYANGTALAGLAGGTGWDTPWSAAGTGTKTVVNGGLNYSNGDIQINGGARSLQFTYPDGAIDLPAVRSFAPQTGTFYVSLLYRDVINTGDDDFAQFGLSPDGTNPTLSGLDNGGAFLARAGTAGGVSSLIPSDLAQTYFLVMRFENVTGGAAFDRVTLYVNPASSIEGGNTGFVTGAADVLNLAGDAYFVHRRAFQEAGDRYQIDSIRIGTSFEDVITVVPEPGAAGLFLFGAALLQAVRSRSSSRRAPTN